MADPRRILVADDHEIVREGVRGVFAGEPDLEVAGEVGDGPAVLERVREEEWDLVLLDLSMPGAEGLETLRRIHRLEPDLPVLVFSIHPEEQLARQLLQAGARGYVEKDVGSGELVRAVRRVLEGERYVSPSLASRLADVVSGEAGAEPHDALSERELQVLRLLGEGFEIGEIAEELSLSPKTVSTYRSRMLDKMDLDSKADLIRYAIERDLVQ